VCISSHTQGEETINVHFDWRRGIGGMPVSFRRAVEVEMAENNQADPVIGSPLPGNYWVRGLTGTTKWDTVSAGNNISWAFATTAAHGTYASANANLLTSGTATGTYNPLSDTGGDLELKQAVRAAVDSIEAVADVNFNEFTSTASFDTVDIKVMGFDNLNALGWGTFPGTDAMPGGGGEFEGFTLLATTGSGMTTDPLLGAGSNRQSTSLHEFLHTIGLGHPHDTGHGSTSWTTSNNTGAGEDDLDNRRYTTMSYERGGLNQNTQNRSYGSDVTPMALDVAALHHLYGSRANHTGNTVYTLTDPETAALDADGNDGNVSIGRAFYSIWDTGGTDQISYSGSNHALINLNEATLTGTDSAQLTAWIDDVEGTSAYAGLSQELKDDISDASYHAGGFFSRVYYDNGAAALGGYSIANGLYAEAAHRNGAVIENATGSNQSDIIIGNEQANTLLSSGGDDVVHGSAGDDTIKGGGGNDTLFGGDDDDTVVGDSGSDTINGGNGDDQLSGGADTDYLRGGSGDDSMDGGSGDDWIYWGSGTDEHDGGSGSDTISGDGTNFGSGATFDMQAGTYDNGASFTEQWVNFENYNNVLSASGSEQVLGTNDANTISTGGGNNTIDGRGGDDTLKGGGGADTIQGGTGTDDIEGGAGDDVIRGGSGVDNVDGGDGNDTIYFTSGHFRDNVDGGDGIDTLDATAQTNSGQVVNFLTGEMNGYGGDLDVANIEIYRDGSGSNEIHNRSVAGMEIYGGGGDDVIHAGNSSFETLDGGTGVDTLDTTLFNGTYTVNLATGATNFSPESFTNFENIVTGNGADTVTGTTGANIMRTNGGNDTLNGDAGDDILEGGSGGDALNGGAGEDTADYSGSSAGVNVDVTTGTASGGHAAGDSFSSIENLIGSAHNDVLRVANDVDAGAGNDRVIMGDAGIDGDVYQGGTGTDTFDASVYSWGTEVTIDLAGGSWSYFAGSEAVLGFDNIEGADGVGEILIGTAAANVINANGGDDTVDGGAGDDTLQGGSGDDTLQGGSGGDALNGGTGFDTAVYSGSAAAVTVSLQTGTAIGGDAAGDTLSSIEGLFGSAFGDYLKGDGGANRLEGDAGDDLVEGGAGADALVGGSGNDTAKYAGSAAAVTISLLTGNAVGGDAAGDSFSSIENLFGSSFADHLKGNAGANVLTGGSGADILDGWTGIDTADYGGSSSAVTISLQSGFTSGGHAAGDTLYGIENLNGSLFDDFLKGDAGANRLDGGAGDDILEGEAGADELVGGTGMDTARYVGSDAAVTISLETGNTAGGAAAGDTLSSIESLLGSAFDDYLKGDSGANTLDGYAGDDLLEGGAGADVLIGGSGIDTAHYAASSAAVTVSLLTGNAVGGDAAGDSFSSIENLIGSNFSDHLKGNAGDNVLAGGVGADILNGWTGNDTADYSGSAAAVTVSLLTGNAAGGDAAGDTLSSIEGLIGSGFDDYLTGDAGANTLDGYAGDNVLEGGAGGDVLIGGSGIDTAHYAASSAAVTISLLTGNAVGGDAAGDSFSSIENLIGSNFSDHLKGDGGNNVLAGGAGGDILDGWTGSDTADYSASSAGVTVSLLTGNAVGGDAAGDTLLSIENLIGSSQSDYLKGDNGDNVLVGGAGGDTLEGLTGNDRFVFYDGSGNDTVLDFVAGAGTDDVLDFSGNSFLNSFADFLANSSQAGADTVIDVGGLDQLTLAGVSRASMHVDDFVF